MEKEVLLESRPKKTLALGRLAGSYRTSCVETEIKTGRVDGD